jgi:hypothetical protein
MFTLNEVVPWGRSFDEYMAMFALDSADLKGRLLGCGDGPASFNAVATTRGSAVVSCDPIYRCSVAELRRRIADTYEEILEQTRQNAHTFVWESIPSVEALGLIRMAAMEAFLADFPSGKSTARYVEAALPELPFKDQAFDLALCSHLLFLYSAQLDTSFHEKSLRELCRVAREVRVFPLLALNGDSSPHLESCIALMRPEGFSVAIDEVRYEFQRGGNTMLRITR